MIRETEISDELEQWAELAGYALTRASRAHDGRALFWSPGGEARLYVSSRGDGWFLITRSDRFGEEQLTFAAASMSTIERYLFGKFGQSIRSNRGLPVVPLPKSANLVADSFSVQPREFDGAERLALIAADGSAVAVSGGGKLIATGSLVELSIYLTATIDEIKTSSLAPDGAPLFQLESF